MTRKFTTLALVVSAMLVAFIPVQAHAGDLLEQALDKSGSVDPVLIRPLNCAEALERGQNDGNRQENIGTWFMIGAMAPGVGPLVAHRSEPVPTDTALGMFSDRASRCYSRSYVQARRDRRVRGAWSGTAATMMTILAMSIASHNPG